MPRKPRVEFEGAVYHVMCRGDHREPIVQDDTDRAEFLHCLEEACGKTEWQLHAYVLMGNHYHLLLETPKANLVAGMHWLQGTYTGRYNRRHRLQGHLFQGRYKPLLIEPEQDEYFLQVGTYIHLNPVRARLVNPCRCPLETYPWSSFPAYLAPSRRPPWLRVHRVLAALTLADSPAGRRAYRQYLAERARQALAPRAENDLHRQWESIRRGWCLGSEGFRARMKGRLDGVIGPHSAASYGGPAIEERRRRTAEELLAAASLAVGLDSCDLARLRKNDPRKQAVAWMLRKYTTVRNRWLSERLVMGHEARVSQAVRAVAQAEGGELARLRQTLETTLKITD